ncbi:hypothetical protein Nepgr_013300 [Nepenthes gracilis]|uniref:Uncharacterized protein n=1 Tax=Nepenthes gracilis TaxID=150966 RepID=A0AAD3XNZ8_NEPGR|nr:hypothetical protein Nepgr_013300 [Nepenthes gracilis]
MGTRFGYSGAARHFPTRRPLDVHKIINLRTLPCQLLPNLSYLPLFSTEVFISCTSGLAFISSPLPPCSFWSEVNCNSKCDKF